MKQSVDHISFQIKLNNIVRSLILFIFDAPFSVTFLFPTYSVRLILYFVLVALFSAMFLHPTTQLISYSEQYERLHLRFLAPFVFGMCCDFLIPPGNIPPNEAHLIFRTM